MSATRLICGDCGFPQVFCQCHARRIAQIEEAQKIEELAARLPHRVVCSPEVFADFQKTVREEMRKKFGDDIYDAQIEEAESLRQDRVAQLAEDQREASGQRMRDVRPNSGAQP